MVDERDHPRGRHTQAALHQYEVDAVLQDNAERVIGVEIKAAETVRPDDFRGLRLLQRRLGGAFHAGFVLYCGTRQLNFGARLACLPISALWTARPPQDMSD